MHDHLTLGEQPGAYDLLGCRMATLGLDLGAIASREPGRFDQMRYRCELCDVRQACKVDLKRDPNNPVWESYCPNTASLLALTHQLWQRN